MFLQLTLCYTKSFQKLEIRLSLRESKTSLHLAGCVGFLGSVDLLFAHSEECARRPSFQILWQLRVSEATYLAFKESRPPCKDRLLLSVTSEGRRSWQVPTGCSKKGPLTKFSETRTLQIVVSARFKETETFFFCQSPLGFRQVDPHALLACNIFH